MANYSLVINSKFKPFSYQELLQPALMSTQAHQAVEEGYADLATKANIWDKMTDPGSKAHSMYESYARDLEQQADRLARYGLTPASRQSMLNMKARYSSDILPIEAAYKRREEQIAEQRKAGNSMIYDYDAATTSLDKFIDNPSLSYRSIDRKDLYTRAMNDFGQYAKALSDYGNGKRLDAFTKTFVQNYGITPDQARDFITQIRTGNLDAANPTLRAVYNALYDSTGVAGWDNAQAQNTVSNTILEGVGAAIGKSTVSPYEDKGAVMAQQLANQKALARYQQELAIAAADAQRMKMYDVNPTLYYSASEVARQNGLVSRELDRWRNVGYFNADGKLTNKGFEALQYTPATQTGSRYNSRGREIPIYSGGRGDFEFYQWATRNGVTNAADRRSISILNQYYSDTRQAIANGTLATGTANFQVYRQSLGNTSDRNLVADKIFSTLGEDGKIYEAGALDANGNITRGRGVTASDLEGIIGRKRDGSGTSNVLYIVNSPTTGESGQQLVELSNGKRYLLPSGIIGVDTQDNLNASNLKIRNAGSVAEVATYANRSNSLLGSILTNTTGSEIKPNDGTILIDLGLGQ